MIQPQQTSEKFCRANPLVPATGLFLLGVALGIQGNFAPKPLLACGAIAWLAWIAAEYLGRSRIAHAALAALLLSGGAAMVTLNQQYVEPQQVGRFAGESEAMVALRVRVELPPQDSAAHGNQYWMGRAAGIWTDHGWLLAQGDILVQSAGENAIELHRGAEVELYGWLSLPETAKNPGAINPRRNLAADRIFAQIRVPRPTGVIILQDAPAAGGNWLSRLRLYLRGKLLEHTVQQDVPAALTLTALLLGHRDPAIAEVSQAFSDAGIAHLLAISGMHIVFFTGLVWALLRYVPLRPRWREILIAAIVGLYVLATPCGPPIVRAAAVLFMVLLARLLGRPRAYLNMLAGAAIIVVLLRPMDIADAGFQLTFVTTAALILFSTRIHAALFERRLAREALAADLSQSRWAKWRYRALRITAAAFVANLIGAATATPLVAYHFGQLSPWAIASGIIAIPFVAAAMAVATLQLLAALLGLGAWLAPLSALCGRALIWIVTTLAALPASAIALRAPPAWCLAVAYAALALWAMRRQLNLSRAMVVNISLATLLASVTWYVYTTPTSGVRITALSAGNSDCILIQTSRGVWAIDAGTAQGSSLTDSAVRPSLRIAGVRQLQGQIITSLSPTHAAAAGDLIESFQPTEIFAAANAWQSPGQTFAGLQIAAASEKLRIPIKPLAPGDTLLLQPDCRLETLWPPAESDASQTLVLRLVCGQQRLLILDPKSEVALATLPAEALQCQAIIFTGPRRGTADEFLLRRAKELGAAQIIWCGPRQQTGGPTPPDEWNTSDGAIQIDLSNSGLHARRAGP